MKSQNYMTHTRLVYMFSDLGIKIIPSTGTDSITHTPGTSLAPSQYLRAPFFQDTQHAGCTDEICSVQL